jgi:hypothetical protein
MQLNFSYFVPHRFSSSNLIFRRLNTANNTIIIMADSGPPLPSP